MALFTYKAMNEGGRVVHGQLDAINLVDLEMRLKRMELDFINGNELRQSGLFRGGKVPKRELINFCFHMEQLTRAGVPILDSLTDLRDSLTHPRFREVIASMIESIEGGRTFSEPLSRHPIFPSMVVQMTAIGEETGKLDAMLEKVAEFYEDEVDEAVKGLSSLMEPFIIVILGVLIGGIVVSMYLPIFKLGQVV